MAKGHRYEFKFVVDGVELPRELRERLAHAVADAGLHALAEFDTEGDQVAVFRARPGLALSGNGGGTQGMAIAYVEADQASSLAAHLDAAEGHGPER